MFQSPHSLIKAEEMKRIREEMKLSRNKRRFVKSKNGGSKISEEMFIN